MNHSLAEVLDLGVAVSKASERLAPHRIAFEEPRAGPVIRGR